MSGDAAFAVYVSCADGGEIRVHRLDGATGELTLVQRVAIGGVVMPLAVDPSRRFLYAARRSDPHEASSFAIDRSTGELVRLGAAPLPDSMASIATDRSGRWLFSASYGGDCIAVNPIGADGVVGPARQVLPTPRHAHAIAADPSNRYVYATSLGDGVLLAFRFDAERGELTPNEPASIRPHPGASPRHFVFSADGRFVYLLNELDAKIDVLALDPATGGLAVRQTVHTWPVDTTGDPWAADLHLSPDGRFLYSCERRTSTIARFAVDTERGTLTLQGTIPTETQPRSFAITPDGRWLVAAGQASHRVSVSAIDPSTGALALHRTVEAPGNPNWIEIVAHDRAAPTADR